VGILSSLVTWPLAPVRGVVALGGLIQRRVDEEMHNPARTRRLLEDLEDARRRGEITPEQERQAQEQILTTRMSPAAVHNTEHEDG